MTHHRPGDFLVGWRLIGSAHARDGLDEHQFGCNRALAAELENFSKYLSSLSVSHRSAYWGPEYVVLTTTAYSAILGSKHPWALGRRCCECWAEIGETIGPMLDGAITTEATWSGRPPASAAEVWLFRRMLLRTLIQSNTNRDRSHWRCVHRGNGNHGQTDCGTSSQYSA